MGGADNGGGYTFCLLPDSASVIFPGRVAFIDAEDPHRSNWARYIVRGWQRNAQRDSSGSSRTVDEPRLKRRHVKAEQLPTSTMFSSLGRTPLLGRTSS